MDASTMAKMAFLCNAIDDGWTVKKRNKSYIFVKNHGDKMEVMEDSYLLTFVKDNLSMTQRLNDAT